MPGSVVFVVDKVTLGQRFSLEFFGPPPLHQYFSTVTLNTHIIITWGMNNRPVGGRSSETQYQPIDMNNNNHSCSVSQTSHLL
jgi:hypothetical protein